MTAGRQLELFAPPPPEEDQDRPRPRWADAALTLERRLREALDEELGALVLTDNVNRIVSARPKAGALEVRIHRSFVDAPPETVERVAEFLGGARGGSRRRALAAIREHFERHRPKAKRRRRSLEPVGRCFDLREILDEVNRRFFGGRLELRITWGRSRPKRRRGQGISLRLGSYHGDEKLVRVHRSLDQADVPRYVVESVVHHEMLHAVIPPRRDRGGRRRLHTPEFRRRERAFPEYERAERWIAENLTRLAGLR